MTIPNDPQTNLLTSEAIPILVHQLRSSLGTIRLVHQTLLEDKEHALSKHQRHLLTQAQARTSRMLYMTDDLLESSTDTPSVLQITKEQDSIEKLLDELLEDFGARFVDKNISFTRKYGLKPRLVAFDYNKLQDVIRNLLDNALKYTPSGGSISITSSYEENDVTVVVSDTGIGVPSDKQEHLFKKFVRMENAKYVDQTGVGLGLYIVKRVVESHGGTIQYKPNMPQGSSFIIKLPLAA